MPLTDGLGPDLAERARQLETLERLSQRFGQSLSGALSAGTAGGKQLSGVLDQIASTMGKNVTDGLTKTLTGGLQGAIRELSQAALSLSFGGPAGFAKGGVFEAGATPFAAGGIVSAPTYFPMRGGLGLMGEAGPEAVMPLARGPDGRLGVRAGGGSSGGPTVAVTIQATDLDSFRRSEAQVSAAIARAVARGRRAL